MNFEEFHRTTVHDPKGLAIWLCRDGSWGIKGHQFWGTPDGVHQIAIGWDTISAEEIQAFREAHDESLKLIVSRSLAHSPRLSYLGWEGRQAYRNIVKYFDDEYQTVNFYTPEEFMEVVTEDHGGQAELERLVFEEEWGVDALAEHYFSVSEDLQGRAYVPGLKEWFRQEFFSGQNLPAWNVP